jgi:hypothetical protein
LHFGAPLAEIGHDDTDARGNRALTPIFARLSLLQPRARPLRRRFDLVLRGRIRGARGLAIDRLGHAEGVLELREELGGLRRHHVEAVGHEQLRFLEEVLRHQVGQARGVHFARRALRVRGSPLGKSLKVLVAAAGADAPLVHKAPRLAALRGGLGHDEEVALRQDLFPNMLLLPRRQEQRQLLAEVRVERVLP